MALTHRLSSGDRSHRNIIGRPALTTSDTRSPRTRAAILSSGIVISRPALTTRGYQIVESQEAVAHSHRIEADQRACAWLLCKQFDTEKAAYELGLQEARARINENDKMPNRLLTQITPSGMHHLEDKDIKAVWAYQFARRRGSVAARLALLTLLGIIKVRSGGDTAEQTATAAHRFGIPTEEWNQFLIEL